jgi:hypothetical protein
VRSTGNFFEILLRSRWARVSNLLEIVLELDIVTAVVDELSRGGFGRLACLEELIGRCSTSSRLAAGFKTFKIKILGN